MEDNYHNKHKLMLRRMSSQSGPRRPILTHLNLDTSWLISFPVPSIRLVRKGQDHQRAYYHLLVDPWLDGTIIAVARWFMTLDHTTKGAFRTMKEVRELIANIEKLAAGTEEAEDHGEVDAVLISTVLDDHCHQESMVQLDVNTPVITVDRAMQRIKSWNHFTNIELMPEFTSATCDWRNGSTTSLPEWLGIARLPSMEWFPALHFATMITFSTEPEKPGVDRVSNPVESLIYSPHGIYPPRIKCLEAADPPIKVLALLHGLDEAWAPFQANLGVKNGLAVQRLMGAKYWIPTHDEHLKYTGLNGYLQSKTRSSLDEALRNDKERALVEGSDPVEDHGICRDVGNGESFVLA